MGYGFVARYSDGTEDTSRGTNQQEFLLRHSVLNIKEVRAIDMVAGQVFGMGESKRFRKSATAKIAGLEMRSANFAGTGECQIPLDSCIKDKRGAVAQMDRARVS